VDLSRHRRRAQKRRWIKIAIATVFWLALIVLLRPMFVRQMLYPAPAIPVGEPPPGLEEVVLELDGGVRAVGWAGSGEGPAVVFLHGNGENLETMRMAGLYEELEALEVTFLALDYPGYGRSTGQPSEESLVAASNAAFAWLGERHPGAPRAIVGWSLGAAVGIQTAAAHADEVEGVVLLSAWDTLPELAANFFPGFLVNLALDDTYDSLAAAAELEAPVLMIHGVEDRIIGIEHGRRLHGAFDGNARFVEIPRAGHNDLLGRPEVWHHLGDFLRMLQVSTPKKR